MRRNKVNKWAWRKCFRFSITFCSYTQLCKRCLWLVSAVSKMSKHLLISALHRNTPLLFSIYCNPLHLPYLTSNSLCLPQLVIVNIIPCFLCSWYAANNIWRHALIIKTFVTIAIIYLLTYSICKHLNLCRQSAVKFRGQKLALHIIHLNAVALLLAMYSFST